MANSCKIVHTKQLSISKVSLEIRSGDLLNLFIITFWNQVLDKITLKFNILPNIHLVNTAYGFLMLKYFRPKYIFYHWKKTTSVKKMLSAQFGNDYLRDCLGHHYQPFAHALLVLWKENHGDILASMWAQAPLSNLQCLHEKHPVRPFWEPKHRLSVDLALITWQPVALVTSRPCLCFRGPTFIHKTSPLSLISRNGEFSDNW